MSSSLADIFATAIPCTLKVELSPPTRWWLQAFETAWVKRKRLGVQHQQRGSSAESARAICGIGSASHDTEISNRPLSEFASTRTFGQLNESYQDFHQSVSNLVISLAVEEVSVNKNQSVPDQ